MQRSKTNRSIKSAISRGEHSIMETWTPEQRRRYDECYEKLEREFQPWVDAIRDAERNVDRSIIINY